MNAYLEEHAAARESLLGTYKKFVVYAALAFFVFCGIVFVDLVYVVFFKHSVFRFFSDIALAVALVVVAVRVLSVCGRQLFCRLAFGQTQEVSSLVLPLFGVLELMAQLRMMRQYLRDSVPSGASSVLSIMSAIETAIDSTTCRVLIPRYEQFRADHIFSYASFGKDSKVVFERLCKWFLSTKAEVLDADELAKLQQVWCAFQMRLDAYHRARIRFEELPVELKDHKKFCRLLNNELNALERLKLTSNLLDAKERMRLSADDAADGAYERKLFYFNEAVLKLADV